MIPGIEAFAFVNPKLDTIGDAIYEITAPMARAIESFDRSHEGSLSKKTAKSLISRGMKVTQNLRSKLDDATNLIDVLSFGSDSEIEAIEISLPAVHQLESLGRELDNKIKNLIITFIAVENTPAWAPHRDLLMQLKSESIKLFSLYRNAYFDLARLSKQYLSDAEQDDSLFFPDNAIEDFHKSVEISHKKLGMDAPKWQH